MSYLDGLINVSFKNKDLNSSIFFPYGKFGMAYIISKCDESEIKRFLKKFYIISFLSLVITSLSSYLYVLPLIFIALLSWYKIRVNKVIKNKEKTSEKYQIYESIKTMAISMGIPTCCMLFLGGILLFIGSFLVFINTDNKILGVIGLLFFGFSLIMSFKLLIISFKNKKRKLNKPNCF